MISDTLRDTRYGFRQLVASPGFTAVAVLTLALGIGATTAMFSVVNGVLLRPLPYASPDRLVRIHEIVPQYGRFSVAPANFLDWRTQATVFSGVAAYTPGSATLVGQEGPARVPNASVSWDLFEILGVAPALGRTFRADEDAPGRNNVIVLSHTMWQQRFGGDPGVLGRSVTLSGTPVTVVGVMPADFYFPSRTVEFWQPIAINPANATRGGHFMGVVARLKTDVTEAQAAAEMRSIAARLAAEYPKSNADESAEVVPLQENIVGNIRPALLTLFAAVGVVILIACANVANLLLVRASVRGKEIAIRAALGAGRRRIVRQMLVESLLLAIAGGVLGLAMAFAAMDPIRTLSAGSIPRVDDIGIDRSVLLFAFAVSLVTGLLFGLAPAWQSSRAGLGEILKEGGRSSSTSGGRWVRSGLLVAEVAMSIVLLVGATLLLRSFARLTGVDPGFNAKGVLAFRVALPSTSYAADPNRIAFFERLLADLRRQPGVTAAGIVQAMPMRGDYVLSFAIEGRPPAEPGHEPSANYRDISPGYFQALGIPVMRGRAFTDHDVEGAPMVAVVDQAFVRRYFPNVDPIGQGIDIGNGTDGYARIVGVVGNVHYAGLDVTASPTMYVPFRQDVFSSMWVLARTGGDVAALSPVATRIVRDIDPGLPVFSVAPLSEVVSDSVAQQRFSMLLVAAFAVTALLLAAVGLYGVVAYTVSQRTQEIGVRVAMGAQRSQVLGMIVGGGMRLALIGLAIGFAASVAVARVTESLLFEMTPFDPVSYAVTACALLVIAALACYVPARRALRVDPIVALRA